MGSPAIWRGDDAEDVDEGGGDGGAEGFLVLRREDAQAVHGALPHVGVLVLTPLQQVRQRVAQVLGRTCT